MPRVAATFPAERPFTASSGPGRFHKKHSPPRQSRGRAPISETSLPRRFLSICLSIKPPLTFEQLPRRQSLVTERLNLQDYHLGGRRPRGDLFIGEKLAISRITAFTGHQVVGIRSRRAGLDRYTHTHTHTREDNRVKWRERRDALISQASGVPYDLPTPF